MTEHEVIKQLRTSENADDLESAVETASDFVAVGGFSTEELKDVFELCLTKIDLSHDRESVLHFLSECSVAMGNVANIDLGKLITMSKDFGTGELLHLLNVLSNCNDAKYIPFLNNLTEVEDEEISLEAQHALAEFEQRSKN